MGIFKRIAAKIKNVGVGTAINMLDNFEAPLAVKIEEQKAKLNAMSSEQQSKWIIDTIQAALRIYANIPPK